jgi:hypothetical protein
VPAGTRPGPRLLPHGGRRPDPPAHARAHRHPHRGNGAHRRPGGGGHPPAGAATELETILDNLGIPNSGINLSYSNAGTIGTLDGEILLSLKEGHRPTEHWVSVLRSELPKRFPGVEFFFQPADIVTQILNFGLPAAIDVQFTGNDLAGNALLAAELTKRIRQIPGAVDAHVHQRLDGPR